jgi:hypothetical protein
MIYIIFVKEIKPEQGEEDFYGISKLSKINMG